LYSSSVDDTVPSKSMHEGRHLAASHIGVWAEVVVARRIAASCYTCIDQPLNIRCKQVCVWDIHEHTVTPYGDGRYGESDSEEDYGYVPFSV
jgi:hypothetical protein